MLPRAVVRAGGRVSSRARGPAPRLAVHESNLAALLSSLVHLRTGDLGDGRGPTTHTFLLYLTDDPEGGSTSLLSALPGDDALALSGGLVDGARTTLYAVHPKAGRLFLMPNACPHEAAGVVRAPKVLIRGELRLADSC